MINLFMILAMFGHTNSQFVLRHIKTNPFKCHVIKKCFYVDIFDRIDIQSDAKNDVPALQRRFFVTALIFHNFQNGQELQTLKSFGTLAIEAN